MPCTPGRSCTRWWPPTPTPPGCSICPCPRLSRDDARELLRDDDTPNTVALTNEKQALRARGDELITMYADGTMSRRQFELANTQIVAAIEAIDSQLSRSDRAAVFAGAVGKDAAVMWKRLQLDRRRAIIAELMTITMRPPGRGRRSFDPSSIEVEWR